MKKYKWYFSFIGNIDGRTAHCSYTIDLPAKKTLRFDDITYAAGVLIKEFSLDSAPTILFFSRVL